MGIFSSWRKEVGIRIEAEVGVEVAIWIGSAFLSKRNAEVE